MHNGKICLFVVLLRKSNNVLQIIDTERMTFHKQIL